MSQSYIYSSKVCAICDYWGGQRTIDTFGQFVTISSPMEKGVCMCPNSCGWKGQQKQGNQSCSGFNKWGPVQK